MSARIFLLALLISCFSSSLYSDDGQLHEPLAAYYSEGHWHFIDSQGKPLFESKKLLEVGGYREGFFRVRAEIDGIRRWAFMDTTGEIKIIPDCDLLMDFSEGMAVTVKLLDSVGYNRLHGYINHRGIEIVPMKYLDATSFSEGLAYVMNEDGRGFIDKKGEFVIGFEGLVGYPFFEGVAAVSDTRYRVGFIDMDANYIASPQFDEPADCSEGLIRVYKDALFGYMDKAGKMEIELKYENARDFKEGMAFVGILHNYLMTVWGLIDRSDKMIVDYKFKDVADFSDDVAAVLEENLWGYINKKGEYLIEPQFTTAASFVNGLAWAGNIHKNEFGFINKKGEYVIKLPKPASILDLRMNREVY